MQMAIDKAKKHGVGFVACRNSTHYGIAGYYATMATDQGCVGLTGTNARPSIAPTFGVEPMLGTNPLTWGIPGTDEFPFVIDCATSVNQRGKIEKYARDGVDTPRGAVIDDQGIERTDTDGILRDMVLGKCALTPLGGAGDKMGGYKGKSCNFRAEVVLCFIMQHALDQHFSLPKCFHIVTSFNHNKRIWMGNHCRAPFYRIPIWPLGRRYLWTRPCDRQTQTNAPWTFLPCYRH